MANALLPSARFGLSSTRVCRVWYATERQSFDTKTGSWTHAIKVNAIPLVDCDGSGPGTATCWEIFNDINESNTAKRISLNVVQIFFTNSAC